MKRAKKRTGDWGKRAFSDYAAFRYGSTKPVTLPAVKTKPIVTGRERSVLVDRTTDLLRSWKSSAFENEAPAYHGLRQALCLEGHPFRRSDAEAAAIVAEGLRILGVKRPPWTEGQRYHTGSPDFCLWCLAPMDEEGRTRGIRFCSPVCATSAIEHSGAKHMGYVDAVIRSARRLIDKSARPPRPCTYCGSMFQSDRDDAHLCSKRCVSRYHKGDRLLADIVCEGCGKTTKPPQRGSRFCSHRCAMNVRNAAQRAALASVTRQCACCGAAFTPTRDNNVYCSPACTSTMAKRAYHARTYVPALHHRTCEWCEQPFTSKMPWATFCCREHREAAQAVMKPSRRRLPLAPQIFDYLFRTAA